MSWITFEDLTAVYPAVASEDTDEIEALIAHVQGLATIEIGAQTEPVGVGLTAAMVQIVHRFYLASGDDVNISQETLGNYSYTRAQISGLGLTNAEKKLLKKAAGQSGFWVQPITRSEDGEGLETAGPLTGDDWLEGAL